MQNYLSAFEKFGEEILEFFRIKDWLKISFKGLSFFIATALGAWSYVLDQFWPFSIIFWTYVAVFIICWLKAFAKTCGEVKTLKGVIRQREDKDKAILEIEEFLKKCSINDPHSWVNIGSPLYQESLEILENNPAISKENIAIFKNDARLTTLYPGHGPSAGKMRILFLNQIIIDFSEIKPQL